MLPDIAKCYQIFKEISKGCESGVEYTLNMIENNHQSLEAHLDKIVLLNTPESILLLSVGSPVMIPRTPQLIAYKGHELYGKKYAANLEETLIVPQDQDLVIIHRGNLGHVQWRDNFGVNRIGISSRLEATILTWENIKGHKFWKWWVFIDEKSI